MGRKLTAGAPGGAVRAVGPRKRRLTLGACALLAVGVSVLAACGSNAADTATRAVPATGNGSAPTGDPTALSLPPPAVISHALAKGTGKPTVTPARASSTVAGRRSTPATGSSSQSGSQALLD